ncbi:outer membrane porin, OprD family, partial [Pseudomonas carnis]|nr:outer membrane porin, OprD family [Pseudomonas carnis]
MSQSARHSCTRLGLLGLGSLAVTLPLGANAEGFIDDAKATLNLRNAYFNRNFTNPT